MELLRPPRTGQVRPYHPHLGVKLTTGVPNCIPVWKGLNSALNNCLGWLWAGNEFLGEVVGGGLACSLDCVPTSAVIKLSLRQAVKTNLSVVVMILTHCVFPARPSGLG